MNYKLHYAQIDLGENDIPCHIFSSYLETTAFILSEPKPNNNIVYLIAINEIIFVSEYISFIAIVFQSYIKEISPVLIKNGIMDVFEYSTNEEINIFLQEYSSYEEAYKVALDMKEESPLCYEK